MKICFVAPRYHPNQHGWVKALQDQGHEVDFVVIQSTDAWERHEILTPITVATAPLPWALHIILRLGIKLAGKKPRDKFFVWPKYSELAHVLRQSQPDIIIVRDIAQFLSLQAFFFARRTKVRAVLYTQHPLEEKTSFWLKVLQYIGLIPYERITPVRKNPHTENVGTAWYVPLAVDFPVMQRRDYSPGGVVRLLFIGKFTLPRKNHLLLLEAIKTLSKTQYHLTMIGNHIGDETLLNQCKALVQKHNLSDTVTIQPNFPHKDISQLYLNTDVFVLPSVREPFSISTLEAMAHGLPVIITSDNGSMTCVTDSENGKIIKPNNLDDLIDALRFYVETPDEVVRYGTAAQAAVLEYYSVRKAGTHFTKFLNAVTDHS